MTIDFAKLNDPAEQAKASAQRAAEQQKWQARADEMRDLVDQCLRAQDALSGRDLELVMSCRRRMARFLEISDAQEKWLRDIAGRVAKF